MAGFLWYFYVHTLRYLSGWIFAALQGACNMWAGGEPNCGGGNEMFAGLFAAQDVSSVVGLTLILVCVLRSPVRSPYPRSRLRATCCNSLTDGN